MLFKDNFKINIRGDQLYIFAETDNQLFIYLEEKYSNEYIEKLFTRKVFYCNRLPF